MLHLSFHVESFHNVDLVPRLIQCEMTMTSSLSKSQAPLYAIAKGRDYRQEKPLNITKFYRENDENMITTTHNTSIYGI